MKARYLSQFLFIGLLTFTETGLATPAVKIVGTIPAMVPLHITPHQINAHTRALLTMPVVKKPIVLEKIELSPQAKAWLAHKATQSHKHLLSLTAKSALPPSVNLGMNHVPVMDQGQHGTCATFATTGAIDAIYGKANYVSQLCNLSLGSWLEEQSRIPDSDGVLPEPYPSGWDGSMNQIVFDQIKQYGFITTDYQTSHGCGSAPKLLKEYPALKENEIGSPMPDSAFTKIAKTITNEVYAQSLLSTDEALSEKANEQKLLLQVKQALANNHRVVFGTMLDINTDELEDANGAVGKYHVSNDSWIVTPQIRRDAEDYNINAGHALIITGYDDNAEITDKRGHKHKGVFFLRNSWSNDAGDRGTYYMSYEFFTLFAVEVIELSPTKL